MRTDGWSVCKASAGNKNLRCFIHAYVIYDCIHVWWYVYAWLRCAHVPVGFENTNCMFACSSLICTCVNMHAYVQSTSTEASKTWFLFLCACLWLFPRECVYAWMQRLQCISAEALKTGLSMLACVYMWLSICEYAYAWTKSPAKHLQTTKTCSILHVLRAYIQALMVFRYVYA